MTSKEPQRGWTERLLDAQQQSLEMLISGAPLMDVLAYLTRVVEEHADGKAIASILLLDEEGCLRNGASPSLPDTYISAIDGIKAEPGLGTCGAAAALGTVIITPDIESDPKWQSIKHLPLALGLLAAWSLPIMARNGRVLGTFGTYFRERRPPRRLERQVVGILARTAALAIEGKRSEAALRESEEWLRAIVQASRDGILVEYDEQIIYINDAYAHLFGYEDAGDLIGQHVSLVISEQDVPRLLDFGKRRARNELAPSVYEFRGKRKDGAHVDVEASVSTSRIGGRAYITTMVRDIASRKRTEVALLEAHDELETRVLERTAELAQTNETLKTEIRERRRAQEAHRQLLAQLVTAQEDERRRISRELHDQMGQHLTAIMLLIDSLKRAPEFNASISASLSQLEEVAGQLSDEVDSLAWELRPTALDDLGLEVALEKYVRKWSERTLVAVDLQSAGLNNVRLPPLIETAIYRIVQEALTNIARYARASSVGIILERRKNHVSSIVEDNGCGFQVDALQSKPAAERGMGLLGMRERAALIGGTLQIETAPGVGTTVYLRIPFVSDDNREENE